MDCKNCAGKTSVEKETLILKKASEITQVYDKQNKRLWFTIMSLSASIIIMALCMVWAVTNAQRITNDAILTALKEVAEVEVIEETTTTTEVIQDTGDGNGNNVYLDGDSTTYNESGAE